MISLLHLPPPPFPVISLLLCLPSLCSRSEEPERPGHSDFSGATFPLCAPQGRRWRRRLRAGLRGGGKWRAPRPAVLRAVRRRWPRESVVPALPWSLPWVSPREDGVPPASPPPPPPAAAEVPGWEVCGRRRGEAEEALWRWVRGNGLRGIAPSLLRAGGQST